MPDEPETDTPQTHTGEVLAVPMGLAMPALDSLPLLAVADEAPLPEGAPGHSMIAKGLSFVGAAQIKGSITVAGEVQGDIRVVGTPEGHVTITETGTLVGDVSAQHISVLGQTVGTLDAAGGEVALHASSSVSGRVRYTHLQVNGADLNAQLERVRADDPKPSHG
jgi:cytoskeletal protein CcmA (bactofilin family)